MSTFGVRWFLVGVILLAFSSTCPAQTPRVFVNENWDSGTPPAGWPCKQAPSACSLLSFNGWSNGPLRDYCTSYTYWNLTGLSTTQAHSPGKSYYLYRRAIGTGQPDGATCDIRYDLPTPYPTKLFIRFYMYLDSGWLQFNTPTSREPFQHFLFTNSAMSGTGFRINLLSKVPWTSPNLCASGVGGVPSSQPYMFFNCENNNTQCAVGAPAGCYNLLAHLNEWIAVEFGFDAVAKKYSVWINGTKVVNDVTVPMSQSNFTMVQLSNFISSEGGTPFSTGTYFDDLVISDSYVGIGDPPPVSPRNLRLH